MSRRKEMFKVQESADSKSTRWQNTQTSEETKNIDFIDEVLEG